MKGFYHLLTFTVAVVDILSFICLQKNSAVPLEEPMANDDPVAANQEMQVESWKRPIPNRQKHDSQMICYRCCHTTSRGSTTCIMCCD
uniref:Hepcidin n=1 Tax=Labrus bergylta TaxID=56723 RepID=A0A3Q3EER6_9LABR